MSGDIDELCLIVKNFPASFTEEEIRNFLQMFDPIDIEIFIGHRLAIVKFSDKEHTHNILTLLHQERLDEQTRLFVEYAPKNRNQRLKHLNPDQAHGNQQIIHQSSSTNTNSTIKRLYATADDFDFDQPPPSYLHYEYPKVNRDIIDAISIALEISPKFYVQVLHLMNRMNLEPPFVAGDKSLNYESASMYKPQLVSTSMQTDEINWQQFTRNKRKFVESDESELETSSDSNDDTNGMPMKLNRKRSNSNKNIDLVKRKQRKLLKMQRLQTEQLPSTINKSSNANINDAFEMADAVKSMQIKIIVPQKIQQNPPELVTNVTNIETTVMTDNVQITSKGCWSDKDILENRIPYEQLKTHPMFENYDAGPVSNCLYIKNIAKDVTEDDLRAIYNRYLEENCHGEGNIRSIHIRLMTTGRMRGQCFVTFDGPYLNLNDKSETSNKYHMIERALKETNGLIVKNKPFVVVYGKGKTK